MPRSSSRVAGLRFHIDFDGFDGTKAALRATRTAVVRKQREMVRDAAEETILPGAKGAASPYDVGGQDVSAHLVIAKGVKSNAAFLTTSLRGKRASAVGLLEFGGTVKTPIEPKGRKQALAFGGGHPVARVTTPRKYDPRLFLTGAVSDHAGEFGDSVRDRIVGEFDLQGIEVDHGI